ncbi:MAG: hypothetical protein ACTHN0_18655 [Aquihabitans sp.]
MDEAHRMNEQELQEAAASLVRSAEAIDELNDAQVSFEPWQDGAVPGLPDTVSLPDGLLAWWTVAAPVEVDIPVAPERWRLYSPDELWEAQAGYRWDGNDPSRTLAEGWSTDWIVIGDSSADPLLVSTEDPAASVAIAMHGAVRWDPRPVAPDPSSLLRALAAYLDLLVEFDGECLDEKNDFEPKEGWHDRLRSTIEAVLPTTNAANLIHYLLT